MHNPPAVPDSQPDRVLAELQETAEELAAYGLLSDSDLAQHDALR